MPDSSSQTQFPLSHPASNAETWKKLAHERSERAKRRPVLAGSMPRLYSVTNLDIDVTENCNLGCLYCFKGEMYAQNMSLETMKSALEWLLQASGSATSVNCNFMGGEPTMRFKQIKRFVPWARSRGRQVGKMVTFSMTTNLTLFTNEMRSFVDEYGFGVLMSIDGAPEVQDASRPAKNGKPYSQIVERWAKSMLRTRPNSTARATLHPSYVATLASSVEYIHSIGFRVMAVSPSEYDEWSATHFAKLEEELEKSVRFIKGVYQAGGSYNIGSFQYYIDRLIRHRLDGDPEGIEVQRQPCGAGRGYMMIDYTGDIWPCHRFDGADEAAGAEGQFRMGNIFSGTFDHRLQRAFIDFDHYEVHKESCGKCPVNEVCGGYCPAANLSDTGSIYTPHDTYCRWANMTYHYAEKLYLDLRDTDSDAFGRMIADASRSSGTGEK